MQQSDNGRSGRNFVFTINNYDGLLDPADFLDSRDNPLCRYCIYQEEIGESGTPHLQGYIEFTRNVRFAQIHSFSGMERAYLDLRRGTVDQAIAYASKPEGRLGGPYTYGEKTVRKPSMASTETWTELGRALQLVPTDIEILDKYPDKFIRYHNGINLARQLFVKNTLRSMEVIYITGPSGCGKSHLAWSMEPDAFWKPKSGDWFDGYAGQKVIILDEFKSWMTYTMLLSCLDKFPMQVPVKGSFRPYLAEKVIITSTLSPREQYPNTEKSEFFRRITTILQYSEQDLNFEEISGLTYFSENNIINLT